MTVSASNDCGEASDEHQIRKIILPKDQISGDSIDCPDDQVRLSYPFYPQLDYLWNNGDNGQETFVDGGQHSLTISEHGCSRTEFHQIRSIDAPYISLEPIYELCFKERQFISIDPTDIDIQWSIGSSQSGIDLYEMEGDHWVRASNYCGVDSFNFQVIQQFCDCKLYVPNAFTANNDQLNDGFRAVPDCERLLSYNMQIFNRWGELLFETDQSDEAWDGTYNGVPVPQSVLLYVINYRGIVNGSPAPKVEKGSFHLLR